jgi:hypothetical protein
MKGLIVLAGLAGVINTGMVLADGNELLRDCKQAIRTMENLSATAWEAGLCFGTVMTGLDTMALLTPNLPKSEGACIPPKSVEYGQAVRIVTKFLEDNPKVLNLNSALLTIAALKDAYPCH